MIYGIESPFGAGKTSFAVSLAVDVARANLKKQHGKTLIFSNIKLNEKYFDNYFYFNDEDFLKALRSINYINDVERGEYYSISPKSSLKQRHRKKFTRFLILFDESGAVQNNRDYKNFQKENIEYINQNRKLFSDIYLISADGNQNEKSMRMHVDWWFTIKKIPFIGWLPILTNIGWVNAHKKDQEGNIAMEKYMAKDENGDRIKKEKPIQKFYDFFYKPLTWSLYDDLHKNIRDPKKYTDYDKNIVQNILQNKYIDLNPKTEEKQA